jgi:uncharacterized membrane protein
VASINFTDGTVITTSWLNSADAFIYEKFLVGSATFNPASLADGAGETTTVTVTGAALGDFALASFSLTTSGITITAWVSATNTVSVRFQNESGGVLDIASGILACLVIKQTTPV